MQNINHLEVILKIASRCNINCSYCYYFNGAETGWMAQSKRMNYEVISNLYDFLDDAILTSNIQSLQIDFHGGEPLLYGKDNFDKLCQSFKRRFAHKVKLSLAIQTNALLVDQQWIEIFNKHNVHVSVSLDGPKHVNDSKRIDHKGEGTFDRALKGIELLQAHYRQPISLLAVINPNVSGGKVYRYLVGKLKIKNMDFLLPSTFNEEISRNELEGVTQYMMSVWEEWVKDHDTNIHIRFFDALFSSLGGKQGYLFPSNGFNPKTMAVTVDTDGKLYGDDSLRANMGWKTFEPLNVYSHTFEQFVTSIKAWYQQNIRLPDDCKGCTWANVCKGGQLEHRYRERNGFNNASVYCQTLMQMYNAIVSFLYINGMSIAKIKQILK